MIKPDHLPLEFKMGPNSERVYGFFVCAAGFEYSNTEKIKYWLVEMLFNIKSIVIRWYIKYNSGKIPGLLGPTTADKEGIAAGDRIFWNPMNSHSKLPYSGRRNDRASPACLKDDPLVIKDVKCLNPCICRNFHALNCIIHHVFRKILKN